MIICSIFSVLVAIAIELQTVHELKDPKLSIQAFYELKPIHFPLERLTLQLVHNRRLFLKMKYPYAENKTKIIKV